MEAAIEAEVDAVALVGDVVDGENDFFEAFRELRSGVERLAAEDIRVLGVVGNHDVAVLPRLAEQIEAFELLGGGGEWQTAEVEAGDETATLWGWSFPRARVSESPLAGAEFARHPGPNLGLLHCDRDQAGSPYAPVSCRELETAGLDGWLLGHIHQPDMLTAPHPSGYLGSVTGMDPGESGARGPWLITVDGGRIREVEQWMRAAILLASAGGLVAAVMAILAQAWLAVAGGSIAFVGAIWALFKSRVSDNSASRRRFERCSIEGPENWRREAVEASLQAIDVKRSELQQALRAKQAEEARQKLTRIERELEILQQEKSAMSLKLGFDPALTAAALDRFVRLVQDYEQAHNEHETARATIKRLDSDINTLTGRILSFLDCWQAAPRGAKGLDALDSYLEDLRLRSQKAETAEREAREAERERNRIKKGLAALDEEEATLFTEAGLETGERTELARRCEQFDAWRDSHEKLHSARVREAERRKAIEGEQDLLDRVEEDDGKGLKRDLELAREQAEKLEDLQEELTTIRTRLQDAGRDHRLEQAMAEVDMARTTLEDKYHEALFADAARLLLDGVQEEYHSDHEPEVLRDARERFLRFTHHGFELELDETEGFVAFDLQQALRSLSELSSATRMQLLLATRVAWTRRLEQGREALPLFLDEALTTSDEPRFSQVAESLEQLALDEGRQVFYLSARRQEIALWERATGNRPHHIDLAAVRFGRGDAAPGEFALPDIESLPAPGGHSPESYAAAMGVPSVNPRRPAGTIHLFHLLRDELSLLYRLMEEWRTTSMGQLEGLLRSSSVAKVVSNVQFRKRLVGRCATARAWVATCRQGRGKTVNRIVLESSGAVSDTFMCLVSELADSLNGEAEALIKALRAGAKYPASAAAILANSRNGSRRRATSISTKP